MCFKIGLWDIFTFIGLSSLWSLRGIICKHVNISLDAVLPKKKRKKHIKSAIKVFVKQENDVY